MTIIRVCLDDEDRKRYGGESPLPEQLVLDTEALKDMTAGELDRLEREADIALAGVLPHLEPRLSGLSMMRRIAAFLALRQSGSEVSWDEFQPRLLRATFTVEADDRPPAGRSGASSEA